MFNSPYAKGGMQTNGPVKPESTPVVGILIRIRAGCSRGHAKSEVYPAATAVEPVGINGWNVRGEYTPVGGGSSNIQAPLVGSLRTKCARLTPAGAGYERPNLSVPAGPTMPQFLCWNNPTIGNGRRQPASIHAASVP